MPRVAPLSLCLLFASAVAGADPSPPPGFKALFNGKDLDGWHGYAVHEKGMDPASFAKLDPAEKKKKLEAWNEDAKKHWTVENGELVNDGKGVYLATDKDYGDVELLIEYKTVAKADSGIYMKAAPQIQIWDSTEEAKFKLGADKGSGGLWNNTSGTPGKDPLVKADKPFGEWNQFRIVMLGERVTVYLNDKLVVDHARLENYYDRKLPLLKAAPIVLQTHGAEIRWRNIYAREIPGDEANKLLAKKAEEGMTAIFNGKDFDGWQGATENYEVVDGAAFRCKKGKGGALFTKDEYADFQVALEFKLPPNGNNGLAIRYPGKGDGAYAGACELQVLDDNYSGKIDPRQAHGSAYGMVAAARGYHRPVGEWNYQVVTVKGPKIEVELNGTRILNADLSTVTEFMANSPHPGKDLKTGYFGFLGHNDPVEFRNVKIKKLDK